MYRILLVDDEAEIKDLIRLYLENEAMDITGAADGIEALKLMEQKDFDLAIIDIMMPKLNGWELIKKIRQTKNIPIIILSAKISEADKVLGYDIGADDYITKPFKPLELVARVKASLRRYYKLGSGLDSDTLANPKSSIIMLGDLTLDLDQCLVIKGEEEIGLTPIELRIMKLFMDSPGRVFTPEQIYEAGWEEFYYDENALRVAISKLRKKVGLDKIKTVRGLGYRMVKDE